MRRAAPIAALLPLLTAGCAGPRPAAPLLQADFRRNPHATGWRVRKLSRHPPPRRAHWRPAADGGAATARSASWRSPAFPVAPQGYYRLTFRTRAPAGGMWFAEFLDRGGEQAKADHVSAVPASKGWARHRYYFQTRAATSRATLRFQPAEGGSLDLSRVRVTRASEGEVLAWLDRTQKRMPAIPYRPPAGRFDALAETIKTLRAGGRLRIVVLGDSIANDLTNSHFDLLIERRHPGAEVTVIPAVRGGTGCRYYARKDRVERYVLAHDPDLLIIAGISHHPLRPVRRGEPSARASLRAIRRVVERVRGAADCEIMLQTGAAASIDPRGDSGFVARAEPGTRNYRERFHRLAERENLAFLDLHGAWGAYLRAHDIAPATLKRDPVHMNRRGRQLVARVMERYFAGDATSAP